MIENLVWQDDHDFNCKKYVNDRVLIISQPNGSFSKVSPKVNISVLFTEQFHKDSPHFNIGMNWSQLYVAYTMHTVHEYVY